MKHIPAKLMLLAFSLLLMLASCEYDYYVYPAAVPEVSSTNPADQDTGVALNKTVTASFSSEVVVSSVNRSTFSVTQGSAEVSGTVSSDGLTATFIPVSDFAPNTWYTGKITTGVKGTAGPNLAKEIVWTFRTGQSVADTTGDTTIVVVDTISFLEDIIPFFTAKCESCHKGSVPPDLRANKAYNALMSGSYVIVNDYANSILYKEIKPGGGMASFSTAANTALVKRWIVAGAKNN